MPMIRLSTSTLPSTRWGRFVVALAQAHRNQRRGAHAHQRTERRGEVHQREGQRKARDGQRPDPVADEDAVDHVVERRGRHGDDRRHGILHERFRIRSVPSSKAADFISVISYISLKIPLPARTYDAHARGCLTARYAPAVRG